MGRVTSIHHSSPATASSSDGLLGDRRDRRLARAARRRSSGPSRAAARRRRRRRRAGRAGGAGSAGRSAWRPRRRRGPTDGSPARCSTTSSASSGVSVDQASAAAYCSTALRCGRTRKLSRFIPATISCSGLSRASTPQLAAPRPDRVQRGDQPEPGLEEPLGQRLLQGALASRAGPG